METAQERELQESQACPLDMIMYTSLLDTSNTSSSNSCFLFEWEAQFRYFGLGAPGACLGDAADAGIHEIFPQYMESPASEASTVVSGLLSAELDATAMSEELDDLLQKFWDASSRGDVEGQVAFNSSYTLHEKSTNPSLEEDRLGPISSPKGPNLEVEEKIWSLAQSEHPCSSDCRVDPQTSDFSGVQRQSSCPHSSLKRSAPEETETECYRSSKKRKVPTAGVVYPFTVVKSSGLDGGTTLADINERILMPPARPVRHPVGEFACAPRRISAKKPGLSGKMVTGFTRLRTPGRGTITIIRTRG